jgi:polyvinyl alcohol dehydrogenase (cytochrome)
MKTGARLWQKQLLGGDAWNLSCELPVKINCPAEQGPDFDFGAPPLWVTLDDGRELVLAGQKSAWIYALDAASGELVWQQLVGRGGKLGGIHWGMAYDAERQALYASVIAARPPWGSLTTMPVPASTRWMPPAASYCGRQFLPIPAPASRLVMPALRRRSAPPRNW